MKIIIAGSRSLFLYADEIDKLLTEAKFDCTEVVCGGAKGIDEAGIEYSQIFNKKIKYFFPNWAEHGKAAGPIRNKQMAEYADYLLAIWDGKSRGTLNMIENMKKLNKPYYIYRMNNET